MSESAFPEALAGELADVIRPELRAIDFSNILDGSNDHYYIKPTLVYDMSLTPVPKYGIFNRETHLREATTTQYPAAREWVKALTDMKNGEGSEPIVIPAADADEEGGQVH